MISKVKESNIMSLAITHRKNHRGVFGLYASQILIVIGTASEMFLKEMYFSMLVISQKMGQRKIYSSLKNK